MASATKTRSDTAPADGNPDDEQSSKIDDNSPDASTSAEESRTVCSVTSSLAENERIMPPESASNLEIQHLGILIEFLDNEFDLVKQKTQALLAKTHITFELLWYFLPEGSEVAFTEQNSGLTCAGKVLASTARHKRR